MRKYLLLIAILFSMGAEAQINLVNDIWPGPGNSYPDYFTIFNNTLYFSANDSVNGGELWKYSGSGSPSILYDLNPGAASGTFPYDSSYDFYSTYAVLNGKMYFGGNNGSTGMELYQYDGSSAPSLVSDIEAGAAGSYPIMLTVMNSKLYFMATTAANGSELYVYDPSNSSTTRLTDINPGTGSSLIDIGILGGMAVFNNMLYFDARNGTTGYELYVYNPSNNTTSMVSDIWPGAGNSDPSGFYVFNGSMYFSANDSTHGEELYKYTGTGSPTRITDITAGGGNGVLGTQPIWFNNYLVFDGGDTSTTGFELSKLDTSTNVVSLVYDIYPGKMDGEPLDLTIYGNKLYFAAQDPIHNLELWSWDGTNPPEMIEDLWPGSGQGGGLCLTVFNGKLYMLAGDSITGYEPYVYTDTTLTVKSITAGVDVRAYPVPSSSISNISFSNTQAMELGLTVADVNGKEMYRSEVENYAVGQHTVPVDMSEWPSGNYFYRLSNGKGGMVAAGKLIRQ